MNIWTIILAAGASSRFDGPKALAKWGQETLLSRAVSAAIDIDKTIVVSGFYKEDIENITKAATVYNADWSQGMGTSIAAGLMYVAGHNADVALIVPVDQPFITKEHLLELSRQAIRENNCVLTQDLQTSGPPAAVPAKFFPALLDLKEKGLKSASMNFSLRDGPGVLRDIDTREDLLNLQKEL